ncbi:MAG: type II toxin-antitoxin system RatA family toxin [Mariprofundales bacterium]
MPKFAESRLITCSAKTMFDIVMDIESYPQFLPWVTSASILHRNADELVAELVAEFGGIRRAFRTRDRFLDAKLIEIRLEQGPFSYMNSLWTFEAIDKEICRAHFSIEFEFTSRMLSIIATPLFSVACRNMVQAFEARALQGNLCKLS